MKTHAPKQQWMPIPFAQAVGIGLAHAIEAMHRQADALGLNRHRMFRRGFLPFAVLSGCAVFIMGLFLPIGVALLALYTSIILMMLWSPHRYAALWLAGGATVLLLVALSFSPDDRFTVGVMIDKAFTLFTLWVMAVFSYLHKQRDSVSEQLVRDLANGLANVKTLRGLVPICISCKKVRDEHDRWHGIETYLEAHSEATTSRVVCPECRRTWPTTRAAG